MDHQQQFKAELFALLRKYDVEMSTEDGRIKFWSDTQFDENNNVVGDWINLTLGSWEDGR